MWMAPNLLTLLGLVSTLAAYFVFAVPYYPNIADIETGVPPIAPLLFAITLWI